MRLRPSTPTYRAVRVAPDRWDLEIDGVVHSAHKGFRDAEGAAVTHDIERRRRRVVTRHVASMTMAVLALIPVTVFREGSNPDYPPARAFADRMEEAYVAINDGHAEPSDFGIGEDAVAGGVFEIDRGSVVADYVVLTGRHQTDCYVVRWRVGRVPFVARLLDRYPCEPGGQTLSFDVADFEALAGNTTPDPPLDWSRVLPPEVQLRTWVLPVVIVLIYLALHQMVGVSIVLIRGVPDRRVAVERVED